MVLLPPGTPIRPHSPSAKPSLALQRDHSACANLSAPLLVRKTRDTVLGSTTDIPPPCHACIKVPPRQKSVSHRVLSAVKQGLSRSNISLRTATRSTIATTDLETEFGTIHLPVTPHESFNEIRVPRELREEYQQQIQTPYVDLQVIADVERVDINSKQDIWIAISATVRLHTVNIVRLRPAVETDNTEVIGEIPSLRLLFQAAPRHRVLQTLGHKSVKQTKLGDSCNLFVRLRIPKYSILPSEADSELDVLFADLESTLGTLESEVLYVEARYKHTMMEESNSVLVRRTAKIRRHKTESR